MADERPPVRYGELSRRISQLLLERGEEWAGLPMPIPGLRLAIEPSHPWRDRLLAMQADSEAAHPDIDPNETGARAGLAFMDGDVLEDSAEDDGGEDETWTVRNTWFSRRLRQQVAIVTNGQRTRVAHGKYDYVRRFLFAFQTMTAAAAWSIDTELQAMETLQTHLRRHLFDAYVSTGTFIETSPRSGVTYLFRRCRPTVAFHNDRILCTVCLHSLAYYQDTHAGGMCPTDDVLAHLLLMRADEPYFWRKANQHPPDRPESGL